MNISAPADVAKRLKEERERNGLTLQAMAETINVGRATQSNYEAGLTSPALDYFHALGKIGVDAIYVLTGIRAGQVFSAAHPDMLWVAVQSTLKLAAKHPEMQCSDEALGSTAIKIYRTLVEQNSSIIEHPIPTPVVTSESNH